MVNIATFSVAVGLIVMLVALAVVTGFKYEIKEKLFGFGGHIFITNYDSNRSFESQPISINDTLLNEIRAIKDVKHVEFYATKGGIIKTNDNVQGALLKGVGPDFDWQFISSRLVEGEIFSVNDTSTTNQVLISRRMANSLFLKVGDSFEIYFIQDPPRVRKLQICGLYDTQVEEIDKLFMICDIKHIQRLNGWSSRQISGAEIFIENIKSADILAEHIDDVLAYHMSDIGERMQASSFRDGSEYTNIFDWLDLLDLNVWIILSLMVIVAGFNMISGLLILLFEKTSMIGLLKALGMRNFDVGLVFVFRAAFIVLRGMLWGNIIGVGICLLQRYFGIIKLDPVNYFLDTVPIKISVLQIFSVNIFAFVCITILLVLPAMVIIRISPDKTLKAE